MGNLSPIVVFCYLRPDHLRRTLASLMCCEGFAESPIIVYCDGPRDRSEEKMVKAVRELAVGMLGERAAYHFRRHNVGLARSVIEGVGDVVDRFGRAIVIEDDLELGTGFITYMNRALESFADDDKVWQVSGYMFDVPEFRSRSDALFLPMTVSWGWATWKRAWDRFDPRATGWEVLDNDLSLRRRFNLDGAYDYTTMLKRQMSGQLDSWAIRWYWTVFKEGGLVLFPPMTLVHNHGFDGSGSHGRGLLRKFISADRPFFFGVPKMPENFDGVPDLSKFVFQSIARTNGGILGRLVDHARRLFYLRRSS
jgi:hypothetical protein